MNKTESKYPHKHEWQVAHTVELIGGTFRVYLICVYCGAFKSYIYNKIEI